MLFYGMKTLQKSLNSIIIKDVNYSRKPTVSSIRCHGDLIVSFSIARILFRHTYTVCVQVTPEVVGRKKVA